MLTEYQRKRICKGYSVPIMKEGKWYKVMCKNKKKINKIKEQMKKLRSQLKIEMGSKGIIK